MTSFIKITLTLVMVVASAFIMIYVVESFYEGKEHPKMELSVSPTSAGNEKQQTVASDQDPGIVRKMQNLLMNSRPKPIESDAEAIDLNEMVVDDGIHHGLSVAAMTGNLEELKKLLEAGVSADARDSFGIRAIARATLWGHYDAVEMLLKYGASVNQQERLGVTLLMLAANQGDENLVSLFLKHGADPSLKSEDGETALTTAAKKGFFAIADILKKIGPDEKVVLSKIESADTDNSKSKEQIPDIELSPQEMSDNEKNFKNERIQIQAIENNVLPKETREKINISEMPLLASSQATLSEPTVTPSLVALTWAANVSKESIEMLELENKDVLEEPVKKINTKQKIRLSDPSPVMPIERSATIGGKPIDNPLEKDQGDLRPNLKMTDWKPEAVPTEVSVPVIRDNKEEVKIAEYSATNVKFRQKRERVAVAVTTESDLKPNFEAVAQSFSEAPEIKMNEEATKKNMGFSTVDSTAVMSSRESEIKMVEEKLRKKLPSEEELDRMWNEISRIKINEDNKISVPAEISHAQLEHSPKIVAPARSDTSMETTRTEDHNFLRDSKSDPSFVDHQNNQRILELIEKTERELTKITQEEKEQQKWSANDFKATPERAILVAVSPSKSIQKTKRATLFTADDLFKAVLTNAPSHLMQVIGNGVDVDARGALEMTPLMVAAQDGNVEITRILLENGAQVNATNIVGQTAINLASLREHQDIITLLKQYEVREINRR